MTIRRREFLGHMAAGSAVLTMPTFLSGCGVQSATAISQATPENPFMTWFGVDQATAARVMSELTASGADAARWQAALRPDRGRCDRDGRRRP